MYGGIAFQINFVGFTQGFSTTPPPAGSGGGVVAVGDGSGDMVQAVYDPDRDGKVEVAEVSENSLLVNGKEVELDVLDIPISSLEASDDWDSI